MSLELLDIIVTVASGFLACLGLTMIICAVIDEVCKRVNCGDWL